MALLARCLLHLVVVFLGLRTGAVSAKMADMGGRVSLGQWPASTVPWQEIPALEARLRGHYDVSFQVCPPSTNSCANANGDQTTCCPGRCGADNNPVATCQVVKSRKAEPGKASPVGTCPPEAENACYNPDGIARVCCPGSCGISIGNSATCTGHQAPVAATGSPVAATSPPVTATRPPVTATGSPGTSSNFPAATEARFASSSLHTGPMCFPGAPNLCSRADSESTVCCPGACGPVAGNFATCARGNSSPTTAPSPPPVIPTATNGTFSSNGTKLPTPPTGYTWVANPTLTDEFTGSSLNLTKWQPIHPYWSGRPPSRYDPANVAVGGGYAMLTSTTNVTNMNEVANPLTDPWVSSACIASVNASAGFGYYEARIKASNMNMTSGFWLQSQYSEIDVLETIGSRDNEFRSTKMNINTHFYKNGLGSPDYVDIYQAYDWTLPPYPTYVADDFHTYSVWWKDPQNLLFYFDGQPVWQTTPPGASFTDLMYVFLDTEVFTFEGLPSVADLKNSSRNVYYVDYVRAFTLQPL